MRFYAVVLLAASLTCLAQVPGGPQAPPAVDQALRARANAFLDYESKGNNRKAYEMVAEDSRDYYFEAKKEKSASFTIDEIEYGPDLSTATVKSTMKRQVMLGGQSVELPQVLVSRFKLENGEWVWYHDPTKDVTKTIIGEVPVVPADPATALPIPKDLSELRERQVAKSIAPRAMIDKKFVAFTLGKDRTEKVIFHNGNNGHVRVLAEVRGVRDTISVEPIDVMVKPQEDVSFTLTYKSIPESALQGGVLFTLEPFGRVVVLPVRLEREGQNQLPGAPAGLTPGVPAPAAPAAK